MCLPAVQKGSRAPSVAIASRGTGETMAFLTYALASLFAVSSVAGSERKVWFERRYEADPCEDRVIVFTTLAKSASDFEHRFRLNSTDTLFVAHGRSGNPIWEGLTQQVQVTVELFFLRQQASVLVTTLGKFLGPGSLVVKLHYEYNVTSMKYLFSFFVNGEMVSSYRDGKVDYYDPFKKLRQEVANVVKRYVTGINVGYLKRFLKQLQDKWHGYCRAVTKIGNITEGEYALRYDLTKEEVSCSVRSRFPWRHLVFFNSTVASRISRSYDSSTQTHLTVGSEKVSPGTFTLCNITFPDGTVALQSEITRTTPTSVTVTTPKTTARPVEVSQTPSPAPSPTFWEATSGNSTDEGLGETSEASASGAGTAVAVVFVLLALLLGGTFGFFRYRDRLSRTFPKFARVSSEG